MKVLSVVILMAFLSAPPHEGYQIQFEKLQTPLEVNLEISSTSSSIRLANVTLSQHGTLYFFLSDQKAEFTYDSIFESVSNSKNSPFVRVIEYSNSNVSINFSNLQSNVSYYIHYFGEHYLSHKRSELKTICVQTETQKTFSTPIMPSHFDKFFSLFIPIFFILSIVSFCKSIEDKKAAETLTPHEHFDCSCHIIENKVKCPTENVIQGGNQAFLRCKRFFINLFEKNFEEEIIIPQSRTEIECASKTLEKENNELESLNLCGICCERPREVIFLNCGHIYCCAICSLKIQACPIDQKPISIKYRFQVCDKYGIFDPLYIQRKSVGFFNNAIYSLQQLSNANNSNTTVMNIMKNPSSLSEKYVELKQKNEQYKRFFRCIGCNEKKKAVMFDECGHFIYCNECAHGLKECPLDNIAISKAHTAYIS
jgi:hypothetical protein